MATIRLGYPESDERRKPAGMTRSVTPQLDSHREFISELLAEPAPAGLPRIAFRPEWPLSADHRPAVRAGAAASATTEVERAASSLEASEDSVHAYVYKDEQGARKAARTMDDRDPRGPLYGIPFGVKDVVDVSRMPCGCGSRLFRGQIPEADAVVVTRLRAAGAIVLGKQWAHELTCGLDEPPTRNPWRLDRYPGGSSAGGGVSVAVGSCGFALGTDAAGSVRIPAAMTGVVGLKPTYGLISTDGVSKYASAPSIDHMGILAGTVGRAAAVLDVAAESAIGTIDGSVSGMRLGYLPTRSLASLGATEAVIDAYSAAVSQLAELGAAVVDVDPPRIGLAPQAVFTIFPVELAAAHGSLIDRRPDDYTVAVRELLQLGRAIPGSWYESAQRFRRTLSSTMALAFESEQLDALLTPTAPREAMPLADLDPGQDLAPLVAFTCPFNLTGQPAMSLPCGQVDGLPVGLQVVGRLLDERSVLRVGKAYESATNWHKRKPPITPVGQGA